MVSLHNLCQPFNNAYFCLNKDKIASAQFIYRKENTKNLTPTNTYRK